MTEDRVNSEGREGTLGQKCIVVFEATFNEGMAGSEIQKEYSARSVANAEAFGGFVPVANYNFEQNLGNGSIPDFIVVVEYKSKEKAVKSLESEEYQSILPLRDQTFKEVKILITK
ncbi:MAG: hypothetical protein ACI9BF_000651 [Candidatus Paceibacteria bacterium]|jgi:uncharacterized protein (DUF1330 family)